MGRFAILGIGSFGLQLAQDLVQRGNEVIVVDREERRINEVRSLVQKALIADVSDLQTLQQIGIEGVDVVVVSLGDKIDASILTTLHLKELGLKEIIVKAVSTDHAKVLQRVGASQVVFPERDTARRLAYTLSEPNVLDQLVLGPDYSLIELATPTVFCGKSLAELNLRNRYGIQVLLVRQTVPEGLVFPTGQFVLKDSDVLLIVGHNEDIRRLHDL